LRSGIRETQEQVARARDWSVSKFTRIENGNSPISKSDLEGLLRYYGVSDQSRIDELVALAKAAREPGWWQKYHVGDDKAFEAYLGYEDGASSLRMFQGLTVPGPLQTEAYTRQLLAAYNVPPGEVEETVQLRQERQKRLVAKAPDQRYILDETVIRRPVGGEAMRDQLRHLLQAAQKPEVAIRVIPYRVGPHFGLRGPFVLLGFEGHLDDVLYLEGQRRGDLLIGERESVGPEAPGSEDAAAEIASYQDGFNTLQRAAGGPDESMEIIDDALNDS
jgi:transcriptional regulator with XRE-family HTH domain